ncbi:MAG TPA: aminotransferase class I/II-fold pyridoxal phosphate-dependent enzyme [Planctomycetota bacterium]|nr:aminotransferase class I/II-fold pyridoxal phosphate-dependent enzyme [Planctomycetota bacterium]
MRQRTSAKSRLFTESVIREMTRLANRFGAVNLAQGFPDFPAPEEMKRAACEAIERDVNQYAITWGAKSLRDAIAERTRAYNGIACDPETDVTVTCGATEAMAVAMLACVDPDEEVVVFEPFYENYGPDGILAGARPRFVRLRPPDFDLDVDELSAAFGPKTKAIVVNTPNNPTGKVFRREELERIAELCVRHDCLAFTDEIYEYILFDGARHVSLATLPGMAERTITISGLSKTWSATGWRIGWMVAPAELTGALRKVHDFLTVGAPAPLQEAAAVALRFGPDYFRELASRYEARRDLLLGLLADTPFRVYLPRGAYYAMADFSAFGADGDDTQFARALVERPGVAVVPGSSFFARPEDGRHLVRFCFSKRDETLREAGRRLQSMRPSR